MDLVNQPIQYDRRCSEKPFLPIRHSLLVSPPSFNMALLNVALQQMASSVFYGLDSGQLEVPPRQAQNKPKTARRYLYSLFECGTGEASCDSCRDRIQMRSVDQNEPVARARIGSRGIVRDRLGKRRIALNQMHRDDAVQLLTIEVVPQGCSQSVLATGGGTKAQHAEGRAAA